MVDKKAEEYKGRAKEAAGDLTGDEDLQREGETEKSSAKFKQKVEEATDKAKDALTGEDKK